MEKRQQRRLKIGVALIAAATLVGCQWLRGDSLSTEQQSQLADYVQAFHFCVARAAERLDDGQSAITRISALALDFCTPEVRSVSVFLDSTKLTDSAKKRYVDELIRTAANKSAVMLRRLRDRSGGMMEI